MDIEGIERATIAAVAPDAVHEVGGFIVGVDRGTLRRARSAAPLRHDLEPDADVLDEIEGLYRARGYPAVLRIPDVPGQAAMQAELTRRGYVPDSPTMVKTASVAAMRALADAPVRLADQPDVAWSGVFLGEGFDPVDGANRIRNLSRAPSQAFASVCEADRAVAVGAGGFGHGWLSIHAMRTDPRARGRGYAGQILRALAEEAEARGYANALLQVLEGNETARRLYRRAGFTAAWRYRYWTLSAPAP